MLRWEELGDGRWEMGEEIGDGGVQVLAGTGGYKMKVTFRFASGMNKNP